MPTVLIAAQAIQALIGLAPGIADVVNSAKSMIASLFSSGAITAADQDALFNWVDAVQTAVESNQIPPEFTVEPDPKG